jgi:hypothetical protein
MAELDFSRLRRLDEGTTSAPAPALSTSAAPALDFSRLTRLERPTVGGAMAGRTAAADAYRDITGRDESLGTGNQLAPRFLPRGAPGMVATARGSRPVTIAAREPEADDRMRLTEQVEQYEAENPFFTRLQQRLRSGGLQLRQGVDAIFAANVANDLDIMDSIDKGADPAAMFEGQPLTDWMRRALQYGNVPAKDRGTMRAESEAEFGELVESIVGTQAKIAAIPRNPVVEATGQALNAGRFEDAWKAFTVDPLGYLGQIGTESLPQMAPGVALAPVAGPLGMAAGSAFSEYGPSIIAGLQEAGIDTSDPAALARALRDPTTLARVKEFAAKRALIIGAGDLLSGKVASVALAPGKIANRTLREMASLGAQMPAQAAIEGGAEAAAQAATTGDVRLGDLAAEMAGSGVTAPVDVAALAVGGFRDIRARPMAGADAGAARRNVTGVPEAAALTVQPAAQKTTATAVPATIPEPPLAEPPAAAPQGRPDSRAELQRLLEDKRPLADIQAEERARAEATRLAEAGRLRTATEARVQAEAEASLERTTAERERLAEANIHGQFDTDIAALDRRIAEQQQALGLVEGDGTRAAPVKVEAPADLHAGAERTADPTPAQAEAGNYRKRHLKWKGLDIAIETEAGQVRTGIGRDGKPWSSVSPAPYGYFKGTRGRDKDQIDLYIGSAPNAPQVFVVDQIDPVTGAFDEHKIVAGARNLTEAVDIYDAGFSDGSGPARRGAVTRLNVPEFKTWLAKGDTTRALAYQSPKTDAGRALAAGAPEARPAARRLQADQTAQTVEPIAREDANRAPAEADAVLIDRIATVVAERASPTVQAASLAQQLGAGVEAVRGTLSYMATRGIAGIRAARGPGVFRHGPDTASAPASATEAPSAGAEVRQRTSGDIQPSPAGRFTNETDELRTFAAARPHLKGHDAAAAFVLAKQQADGLEHVAVVSADGSETRAAFTSGARDRTTIPDEVMALLADPNANVVLHHNHPLNVGFSPEDLGMLSLPGMRVVAAHSMRASYSATLTDDARELAARHGPAAFEAFLSVPDAGWNAARDVLVEAGARGEITASQINALVPHIAALAAERAGMIEYRQNGLPSDFVFRHAAGRMALDRATAAANLAYRQAKAALEKLHGKDLGRGPAGPGSIRQRTGGLPQEGQGLAERRRGSEIRGAPRRARPGGPPEDGALPGVAERQGQPITPIRRELRQRQATDLFGPDFTASPASVRDALMASALSRTERMRAAAGAAMDRFRIGAQDKMLRLKRIQEAIETARSEALPASQDAYLGEELYHGITGELIDRFRVERIEPLAKAISQAGVTVDQLNEFVYARHTPERNAQIAKINPDLPDGGSGMTDAEAADVMNRFRADGLYERLDRIAREHVDPIIRATVETLTSGDLIDAQTRVAWNQTYRHYVPLRGFEQGGEAAERLENERARIGRGFDIRGEESKRALGRKSRAGDILAHIIAAHEEATVRAEKNKVGKTFLRLVQANPNPELWEVDTAPLERVVDNRTGLVTYRRDPRYILADNVMAVKVGGEAHFITIHDPLLARAMKNLGAESMNGFIRAVNAGMRLLAKLLTQWNPAFTVPNLVRDLQTALINIQAQDVPQIAGQIVRDVPAAMKGAFQGGRGAKETEWQRWYREFGESGGKISFFGLEDIETRAKQIRAMVRDLGPGNVARTRRTLRATGQLISDLNGAVENATRLSAYANLRRKGVPKERAASIARNLTVNFNRRGEWGPYLNAAYLFYNASLQGSVTMVKALARSRKVQAIAAGGILLGALQDILNHALSPDDDDTGENRWDAKIGEWTKDHNLVFMNPWADSDDIMVAFKLPLPYGYNIFPMIGRRISETLRGKEGATAGRSSAQVVAGAFDSFSPVGSGSTLFDGWEGFVRGVSPTLMQPMVEIAVNMDYKGDPIQKSKEQYGRPIPEHMRGFKNTGPVAAWVTKQLAEMTGGSDVREGAIDISPAAIDHLAEFFTGGMGSTLTQALELPVRGIEGEWDEVSNPRNWPVMNRFIEGKNQWYDNSRYYDIAGAVEVTEAEMKAAARSGDTEREAQIRADRGAEVSVIGRFRITSKRLAALRKALAAAEAAGDEGRAEELQHDITALQRAAIRAYVEALKKEHR